MESNPKLGEWVECEQSELQRPSRILAEAGDPVIRALEVRTPEDFADYNTALDALQRLAERRMDAEVWQFLRNPHAEITFRGMRVLVIKHDSD